MTTGTITGTSPNVLDDATFIKNIFTVTLAPSLANGVTDINGDFVSYAAIMAYIAQNDDPGDHTGKAGAVGTMAAPALDPAMIEILNNIGPSSSPEATLPIYYTKGKCRDTSIGGNDAINCYSQFNETDDVAEHPFLVVNGQGNTEHSGMGRVYSEMYDDQQQIMYLTFGVPKYNNLTTFYGKAIEQNLATLMNSGISSTAIGSLVGSVAGAFISIPPVPLAFLTDLGNKITDTKITKYYEFKSTMPLYYRCVNSIVLHLTINMGLSKDGYLDSNSSQSAGGTISNLTPAEQLARAIQTNNGTSTAGLPDIFQKYGFDIYRIFLKKYQYMTGFDPRSAESSDDALLKQTADDTIIDESGEFLKNFITEFENQLYDASLFVGFRVEKGVDTSESFSNETGESSIASAANQTAQSAQDRKFGTANGQTGIAGIDSIIGTISAALTSATAFSAETASLATVLAGGGNLDFPEVWKSSSFSKSYHFNMSLRTPYGDPYSILQNLYIPLALILAGGLPRGIGAAAYTSPFICRAYCKGMFAVPLGMITSISVKRGADQFGWTSGFLPTCIDISFEIKDLSPVMYTAIGTGDTKSAITEAFGANSNFQEYLLTLSGMGIADRLTGYRQLKRKANYLLGQLMETKFSSAYWGTQLGNTFPARMLSRFIPSRRLPNKK